jgi:hypothetical protein
MKTVDGVITDVRATAATATMATRGPTERTKSNSILVVVAGRTKCLTNPAVRLVKYFSEYRSMPL